MISRTRLLALAVAGAAVAGPVHAQERRCDLVRSAPDARIERTEVGGVAILILHDPFRVRCTDGTDLRADRGVIDQGTLRHELHGNVFYEDPIRTLTADDATYDSRIGRIHATGNVDFVDRQEGSTIRGPELEYFRPMQGRPEPVVNARQRPHLTLQPREESDDPEPLEIDADVVTIRGRDQLEASGTVVITRTDLLATAREASYTGASGDLELRGGASIESGEYDLAGEVVQARLADGVLEHVHARTDASLTSDDLDVAAPDLQIFFADELLQRAVARVPAPAAGGPRAVATSRTFRLEADSIDALIPGQRIHRVVAIGSARGESIDTAGVRDAPVTAAADRSSDTAAAPAPPITRAAPEHPRDLIDSDWIRGDTIIGFFAAADTTATEAEPGDTTVVLERIIARGSALSLYRVERDQDAARSRGRLNFLAGETIELTFTAGELEVASVDGLQKGLLLDPAAAAPARTGGAGPKGRGR